MGEDGKRKALTDASVRRPCRACGPLGERSLASELELAHRQEAFGRHALVSHDAEQPAGGLAGVFGEHREVAFGGEPLAQLPLADRADGEAEVGGNLLQGEVAFLSPVFERNRKAGTDVAL